MKKYILAISLGFVTVIASNQALGATTPTATDPFTTNLFFGVQATAQVKTLQKMLSAENLYSGPITGNFLNLTLQGVKQFQIVNDIVPSTGYFGPLTRAKANAIALSENPGNHSVAVATPSTTISSSAVSPAITITAGTPAPSNAPTESLLAFIQMQINSMFQTVQNLGQRFFSNSSVSIRTNTAAASDSGNSGSLLANPALTPSALPSPSPIPEPASALATPTVTVIPIPATTTLTVTIMTTGGSAQTNNFNLTVKDNTISAIIFSGAAFASSQKFTLTQGHSYSVAEAETRNSTNYTIVLGSSCMGVATATAPTCTITNTYNPPASPPMPNPAPSAITIPSDGSNTPIPIQQSNSFVWGAYAGDSLTSLASFESIVGKPVDIQAMFDDWSSDFPSQYSATVGQKGKTLLIFWEPNFGLDTINTGSEDSYITQFATEAKAYGYPVILVPFAEMNLNEAAWGAAPGNSDPAAKNNTPAKFVQTWQHVYNLFAAAGATNVKFAWDVNSSSQPNTAANSISSYYPGSSYVDYVGVDGFNFGDPTQSFQTIFDSPVSQIEQYGKPIYIFSMGSYEYSGKAAWITEGLGIHIKTYANIAGWIWFNQNDASVPSAGDSTNWMVNSDPAALAAFQAAIP